MDFDVVRNNITNAYRNYKLDDAKFENSMYDFYKEGAKNPSVAKIMMQDYVRKGQEAAKKMLTEVAAIHTPSLLEASVTCNRVYNFAAQFALRSIEASDMYNCTPYNEYTNNLARKAFDERWNELYPRTAKIRERIICANRMSMDNVTPKASWLEKVNFAKTLGEYKLDYPKTFYARYWLIMNSHIEEGSVTSKVKHWYNRFFYKRLIKGHFGFKK